MAIALASQSNDPETHKVIAESSWTAFDRTGRTQRYHRSLALLKASQVLNRSELLERADSEIVAVWLQREPDNPHALRAYATLMRKTLQSRRTTSALIEHRQAFSILLDRVDEEFWSWLDHYLSNEISISEIDLMDQFPLPMLAEALMNRRPKLGLMLWTKLKTAMEDGIVKVPRLFSLPFVTSSNFAEAARNDVLAGIVNDQELSDLVHQAEKSGQMNWLVDKALELAGSAKPESLAMSTMLLGFADERQIVEDAWSVIDGLIPCGGWLESVYQTSRQTYERNKWARHWYRRYIQATTDSEAIAAHMLLVAVMDTRAMLWIDSQCISQIALPLRRYWDLNTELLKAASKKRREKLKNTLFWTKTMKQTQWPWLR